MAYPCNKCGETKPETEFYKSVTESRGCRYSCKVCYQAAKKARGRSVNDRLYSVWSAMMKRCYGETKDKELYFGRGITVCKRWQTYRSFRADMKPAFVIGLTLDRIDNDKGYSPENCRWATAREQALNRRSTIWLTYRGQTKCLSDWARELGIGRTTIKARLDRDWDTVEALEGRI